MNIKKVLKVIRGLYRYERWEDIPIGAQHMLDKVFVYDWRDRLFHPKDHVRQNPTDTVYIKQTRNQ